MLKKILFTLLAVALLFSIIKQHKIKKSFLKHRDNIELYLYSDNFYQKLVSYGIMKKCYVPHPDIIEIFAQEGFNYEVLEKNITSNSLKKLEDKSIKVANKPKIPTITHRVYFTTASNVIKLNDFYVEELKTNFNRLNNLGYKWQHIIWTNQVDLFPSEISSIKGVEVKSISEFENHPSYQSLLEIINNAQSFKQYLAEASDLMRLMAVQRYGGVYNDMDYEIYNPAALFELMRKFDFIGTRETVRSHSFYQNAFFAAKPNHPILNYALEKHLKDSNPSQNNLAIPDYVKYPCKIYDEVLFKGPVLITLAYFAKNNIDRNTDIILPSWMAMNVDFARYKNQTCKLNDITESFFNRRNNNLDKLLADFTAKPDVPEWQFTCNADDSSRQNIYYNPKYRAKFDIIGADMSCGTWITGKDYKKYYYWDLPFSSK